MSRLLLCFLTLSFISTPVLAQEEVKPSKEEIEKLADENKRKVEDEIKKDTPITEWLSSENALLDRLPEQNKQTFFIIRSKHSTMRAIETVREDIGSAVQACSKENPDLKKQMNERFDAWKGSVNPVLKEARTFLKQELKEQTAFHMTDYNHIIKLNDKAYKFSNEQVKKTPVTSKDACLRLVKSMDRTEDNLISLMQDILIPEEVIRSRSAQAEKAKEKKPEAPKK